MIPQNRFEPRSAPQRGGGINMIQNALMGQNRAPQGGMMGGPGPAPIRQPSQMQNMMGAVQAVGGMGPQQAPQYTPQQVQGMRANAQPMQNFAQRAGQMMNRTMPAPAPSSWMGAVGGQLAPAPAPNAPRPAPSLVGMMGRR